MFCTSCGNQLKDGARFCTKCGKEQKVKNAPVAPADPGLSSKQEPALNVSPEPVENASPAPVVNETQHTVVLETPETNYSGLTGNADITQSDPEKTDTFLLWGNNKPEDVNPSVQLAYENPSASSQGYSQPAYENRSTGKKKSATPLIPIIILASVAVLLVCTAGVLGFVFRNEIVNFVSGSKNHSTIADLDDEDLDIFGDEDEDGDGMDGEGMADSEEVVEELADFGDTLTIECWNDEWQTRFINYMPGYTQDSESDPNHGHIGDLAVEWIVTPSDNGAYRNRLDKDLNEATADVDIFLIEADYAGVYTVPGVAKPLSELQITDEELANQYPYTKQIVTIDGVIYGTTWQTCCGGLIYNRSIAKKVLGSDDPDVVQDAVSDWDKFCEVAKQMKANKYKMVPTVEYTERIFSNNKYSPIVSKDGTVTLDAQLINWVNISKLLVDGKMAGTAGLWDTNEDFQKNKSFCVFGPSWYFDYCMQYGSGNSIADKGGWGYCRGPQPFFWGGTWICVADKTDNAKTAADVLRCLTMDEQVLQNIFDTYGDEVNNRNVMSRAGNDTSLGDSVLGGQNQYMVNVHTLEEINCENYSKYDQLANESLITAMKEYFTGKCNYDTAENNFYASFLSYYPELHR